MHFECLRNLKAGESALVYKVTVNGDLGRRLREMGLVPDTKLTMMGRAPLNDPVEVKLMGYNLTLRNNEADHILVRQEQV